jgi:hydroxypyruvate isomerase
MHAMQFLTKVPDRILKYAVCHAIFPTKVPVRGEPDSAGELDYYYILRQLEKSEYSVRKFEF